jgi:hypothetical protein
MGEGETERPESSDATTTRLPVLASVRVRELPVDQPSPYESYRVMVYSADGMQWSSV